MVEKHHSDRKEAKGRILQSTNTIDDEPYLYSSDASIEDFDKELVRDWMTPNPISVGSDTSLIDASWLMIERNIRRLPVIDIGTLIGLITLEDIRCVIPPSAVRSNSPIYKKTLSGLAVEEIMTPDPVTISQDARLVDAARLMMDNKINTLPVVDGDVVVGIITERDIFRGMVELCLD